MPKCPSASEGNCAGVVVFVVVFPLVVVVYVVVFPPVVFVVVIITIIV